MVGLINEQSTVCIKPGLVTEYSEEGEALIRAEPADVYYGLNPVGGRVWSLIQNPTRVDHVFDVLVREYDVDPDRCRDEVLDLLNNLIATDLVMQIDEADQ